MAESCQSSAFSLQPGNLDNCSSRPDVSPQRSEGEGPRRGFPGGGVSLSILVSTLAIICHHEENAKGPCSEAKAVKGLGVGRLNSEIINLLARILPPASLRYLPQMTVTGRLLTELPPVIWGRQEGVADSFVCGGVGGRAHDPPLYFTSVSSIAFSNA